ncbi:MAG: type II toxin-antitoxin system HicB family antitoxin [Hyphomicrobiaceae bacterium]|nr:MAG: type II toxin-antitoxin system HicB family antitoxin [Hyphomicrobiaceae bacterium]
MQHRSIRVGLARTYTVILEPLDEGGFLVHVPALPEVVTGGDTEDEALAMAKEAIELVLASRAERGEEIPTEAGKASLRQVTVSIAA